MLVLVVVVAVVTAASGQLKSQDDVVNEVNPKYVPDDGYDEETDRLLQGLPSPAPTLVHDTDVNLGAQAAASLAEEGVQQDALTTGETSGASGVEDAENGKKLNGKNIDQSVLEEVFPHKGESDNSDANKEDGASDPSTLTSESDDSESSLTFEENGDKGEANSQDDLETSNGFLQNPSNFNTNQGSSANFVGSQLEDTDNQEIPAVVQNVEPPNQSYNPANPSTTGGSFLGAYPGAPSLGSTHDENYSSVYQSSSQSQFGSTIQEMNVQHSVQQGPVTTSAPTHDVITQHSLSTVHSTDGQSSYLEKTEIDQKYKHFPHPDTNIYKTEQKNVPPGLPFVHIKPGKTPSKYPIAKYPYLMKNHLPVPSIRPTKLPLFTPVGAVDPALSSGAASFHSPDFHSPQGEMMRGRIAPRVHPLQKLIVPQHPLGVEHPLGYDGFNYLPLTYFDPESYPGNYPVVHQPLLHHVDHGLQVHEHVLPHRQLQSEGHHPSYLPDHPYLGMPMVGKNHPAVPGYPGQQAFWLPHMPQRPVLFK